MSGGAAIGGAVGAFAGLMTAAVLYSGIEGGPAGQAAPSNGLVTRQAAEAEGTTGMMAQQQSGYSSNQSQGGGS